MNLSALIPVPYLIQRRAWECAFVLTQEFPARLARHEAERLARMVARDPRRMDWEDVREAKRLHAAHVAVRR